MKKIIIMLLVTISLIICFTTQVLADNNIIDQRTKQVQNIVNNIPQKLLTTNNISITIQSDSTTQFFDYHQKNSGMLIISVSNEQNWYTDKELIQTIYNFIGQQIYYSKHNSYNNSFANRFTNIMLISFN